MHYVYILQSKSTLTKFYVGKTNNLKRRVSEHKNGDCYRTSRNTPWHLYSYFAVNSKVKASDFKKYLKTSRGRRFAKKHF